MLISPTILGAQKVPDPVSEPAPTANQTLETPLVSAAKWFDGPLPATPVPRAIERAAAQGPRMDRPPPGVVRLPGGSRWGIIAAGTVENELFCSGSDDDCVIYGGSRFAAGAAIGAGVGALVGWIASLGRE